MFLLIVPLCILVTSKPYKVITGFKTFFTTLNNKKASTTFIIIVWNDLFFAINLNKLAIYSNIPTSNSPKISLSKSFFIISNTPLISSFPCLMMSFKVLIIFYIVELVFVNFQLISPVNGSICLVNPSHSIILSLITAAFIHTLSRSLSYPFIASNNRWSIPSEIAYPLPPLFALSLGILILLIWSKQSISLFNSLTAFLALPAPSETSSNESA